VTQCDIATDVTVATTITLTRVTWHIVTLPVLLRSPIKLHLHLYRVKVWYCHCCYGRQKITLKSVRWQNVTVLVLSRSPIKMHLNVYRDTAWHFNSCYCPQYNYTYTCIVTNSDIATVGTVANKITLTHVLCHSVKLPLLLRSTFKFHLQVYRVTVWNCHFCYDGQYNYIYTCTVTKCEIATFLRSPIKWHLHVYCDAVWHCHRC